MPKWTMVIDLDKCTGCQACMVACKVENNVPQGSPEEQRRRRDIYWNKMIAVTRGRYPKVQTELIPMPCMQCDNPPCVTVCPAKATYRREDGIVIQNYRKCIGCKYCMVACPYGARSFNFRKQDEKEYHRPDLPPDQGSREVWPFPVRTQGVVEKCTFCFHRIDRGIREGKRIGTEVLPACVEACPSCAMVFGDLGDPKSPVSNAFGSRTAFRLREELKTNPKVIYLPR